jgi:hypothetical protein
MMRGEEKSEPPTSSSDPQLKFNNDAISHWQMVSTTPTLFYSTCIPYYPASASTRGSRVYSEICLKKETRAEHTLKKKKMNPP